MLLVMTQHSEVVLIHHGLTELIITRSAGSSTETTHHLSTYDNHQTLSQVWRPNHASCGVRTAVMLSNIWFLYYYYLFSVWGQIISLFSGRNPPKLKFPTSTSTSKQLKFLRVKWVVPVLVGELEMVSITGVLSPLKYKCQYNQLEDICIITNWYLNVCFDTTQRNDTNTCLWWSPSLL